MKHENEKLLEQFKLDIEECMPSDGSEQSADVRTFILHNPEAPVVLLSRSKAFKHKSLVYFIASSDQEKLNSAVDGIYEGARKLAPLRHYVDGRLTGKFAFLPFLYHMFESRETFRQSVEAYLESKKDDFDLIWVAEECYVRIIQGGYSYEPDGKKELIKPTILPRDLTIMVGPPGPAQDKKMMDKGAARNGVDPEEMYIDLIYSIFSATSKIADGESQSAFDKLLSSLVGREVWVKEYFPTYTIMKGQLLPVFIIKTDNIVDATGLSARIDLGNKELQKLLSSFLGLALRSEWIRTFVSYFDEKGAVQ